MNPSPSTTSPTRTRTPCWTWRWPALGVVAGWNYGWWGPNVRPDCRGFECRFPPGSTNTALCVARTVAFYSRRQIALYGSIVTPRLESQGDWVEIVWDTPLFQIFTSIPFFSKSHYLSNNFIDKVSVNSTKATKACCAPCHSRSFFPVLRWNLEIWKNSKSILIYHSFSSFLKWKRLWVWQQRQRNPRFFMKLLFKFFSAGVVGGFEYNLVR